MGTLTRLGNLVTAGVAVAWFIVMGLILRHRVFISHDTLISYAHVWYVSGRIWHGHGIPLHMPMLGHGQAYAFPYGLVPWLTAAIVHPLGGDRIVTMWLVGGALGLIIATFWAFPELRRGWWAATVLLNPALFSGMLMGQMPFVWGSAMLMGAVGCWRRQRWWWATVLAALAQITHPAVVAPLAVFLVAGAVLFVRDRSRLVCHFAFSLIPALPAAWLVLRSPVFVESSTATKLANFATTLLPRSLVLIIPLVIVLAISKGATERAGVLLAGVAVVLNVAMWQPLGMPWAWQGLSRQTDTAMLAFLRTPDFVPGQTYRLLRAGDGKVSMYQLLQAGGRLDSEFFPESFLLRSWPSEEEYSAMLRDRSVDAVMIWRPYGGSYRGGEARLLAAMARRHEASCDGPVVCVHLVRRTRSWTLYGVARDGPVDAVAGHQQARRQWEGRPGPFDLGVTRK